MNAVVQMSGITIQLTPETIPVLEQGGYALYGFKAVSTTASRGLPTIWLMTQAFSANMLINWQNQFSAYTSTSEIIPGAMVVPSASYLVPPGSTLEVNAPDGTGTVTSTGQAGTISILNQTENQFTAGIGQIAGSEEGIVCVLPLYGQGLDYVTPLERVLLVFATSMFNPGMVVEQLFSQGVMVDATAPNNNRTVTYDINDGWSWDGGSWASPCAANSALAPLLIQSY